MSLLQSEDIKVRTDLPFEFTHVASGVLRGAAPGHLLPAGTVAGKFSRIVHVNFRTLPALHQFPPCRDLPRTLVHAPTHVRGFSFVAVMAISAQPAKAGRTRARVAATSEPSAQPRPCAQHTAAVSRGVLRGLRLLLVACVCLFVALVADTHELLSAPLLRRLEAWLGKQQTLQVKHSNPAWAQAGPALPAMAAVHDKVLQHCAVQHVPAGAVPALWLRVHGQRTWALGVLPPVVADALANGMTTPDAAILALPANAHKLPLVLHEARPGLTQTLTLLRGGGVQVVRDGTDLVTLGGAGASVGVPNQEQVFLSTGPSPALLLAVARTADMQHWPATALNHVLLLAEWLRDETHLPEYAQTVPAWGCRARSGAFPDEL